MNYAVVSCSFLLMSKSCEAFSNLGLFTELHENFRENEGICRRKQIMFSSRRKIANLFFKAVLCFGLAGCLYMINLALLQIKIKGGKWRIR